MFGKSWLASVRGVVFGSRSRSARRRTSCRSRLGLEVLEVREVPAGFTLDNAGNLFNSQGVKIDAGVTSYAQDQQKVVDLHGNGTLQYMNADGSGTVTLATDARKFVVAGKAAAGTNEIDWLNTSGYTYEQDTTATGFPAQIGNTVTDIALAGNGDLIQLNAAGLTFEHQPGVIALYGHDQQIGSGVKQIAIAGSMGDVIQLNTLGMTFEHTPGGPAGMDPLIGSGVTQILIASNGDLIQLNNQGMAFEHKPGLTAQYGNDPRILTDVSSISTASDGNVQLATSGITFEHNPNDPAASVSITGGGTVIATAPNGDLIRVANEGLTFNVYEQTPGGLSGHDGVIGSNLAAVAVAGNGGIVMLNTAGALAEHTPGTPLSQASQLNTNVQAIAVTGNYVYELVNANPLFAPGHVIEHTAGTSTANDRQLHNGEDAFGVSYIGIAHNGDLLEFVQTDVRNGPTHGGNVFEHTPGASGVDPLVGINGDFTTTGSSPQNGVAAVGFHYGQSESGIFSYFQTMTGTTSSGLTVGPVVGTVSNGVLNIAGDLTQANQNDTLALSATSSGGVMVTLNGQAEAFDAGTISSVSVGLAGGSNSIQVTSLPAGVGVSVYNYSSGSYDYVTVGNGSLANVAGTVAVSNSSGATSLTVDDSGDASYANVAVSSGAVQFQGRTVASYTGGATGVNSLTVKTGSGGSFTSVNSTAAGTPVWIDTGAGTNWVNLYASSSAVTVQGAGGQDYVTVGANGSLASIAGPVNVSNGSNPATGAQGQSHVSIDDYNDAVGRNIAVSSSAVSFQGLTTVNLGYGVAGVNIYDGYAANTITASSVASSAPVTVYGEYQDVLTGVAASLVNLQRNHI